MIINIALGIVLGVVFLIVAGVIAAAIGAGIVHMQDKIQEPQRRIHTRIRPEAENYKHMQQLKQRAKENNPSHWKEERYED